MTIKIDLASEETRRRVCTPEEQREFATLGRKLLQQDVTLEEIRQALGYEEAEGVQHALDFARVTKDRLEALRELAREKLGTDPEGRLKMPPPTPKVWTPPPSLTPTGSAPAPPRREEALPPEAQEITRQQHERFREMIDRLRAVDARFRSWELVAKACGLAEAGAAEDAYEFGTKLATFRQLEAFRKLHAAFGSRATVALMQGIPMNALRDHLLGQGDAASESNDQEPRNMDDQTDGNGAGAGAAVQDAKDEGTARGAGRGRGRARRRKKVHLDESQHRQLRELVEELWARDKKLDNWTLLARAGGLSTGPAMKRAYEVNSSTATLQNLRTFARAHARFGSAAVAALREGIDTDQLEAHLAPRVAPTKGAESAAAQGAAAAPSAGVAGRVPPHAPGSLDGARVDFSGLVELGGRIDAEVQHLIRALRMFEDVAREDRLPRMVRANAAAASERLRGAIELFASGGS